MTTATTHASATKFTRPFRRLLPWLLTLAAATCTTDRAGPSETGVGYFSFRPVYGLAGGNSLSQFGIVADSVRITLTRPVDQVVLDTTVFFPPDSTSLSLALPVVIEQSPETLQAVIAISAGGTIIFIDSIDVEVQDGPPGTGGLPVVTFDYVGPGSNIAALTLTPGDTTIVLGDTLFFTAAAVDSSALPVANFYVAWSTTDTTIAKMNAQGRLIAPANRTSVRVVGVTPTGIADTTTVVFAPVPVIITADSGGGQTGVVGDSLGALFVARVKAADSLGVAGIPVRFQAVTAGGAVRDTLVYTDAQGRARTRGVLGGNAVSYNYSATALGTGLSAAVFIAGSTSGAPVAIAILGGNAQTDTASQLLPLPFTVRVADAFDNPVAGAKVIFDRFAGFGTPALDTITTNATGVAALPYTLGNTAGIDSVRVTLVGTSAFVDFTATAIAGVPATITADSGDSQTISAGADYTDSLVVRVLDAGANPVTGVAVAWSVASGNAILTGANNPSGADGRARIGVTAFGLALPIVIQATVAGVTDTATFTLAVTPASPATIVIDSGNGQSGAAGSPLAVPLTVIVLDGYGNRAPGATINFAVTTGGGTVDSATATTDSNGVASAGSWTLGPVAGANQVRATSPVVTWDTLYFDAVGLPAGTSKFWTGASDNLWSNAANWSPSGVPTSTDNVFIPAGTTSPSLFSTSNTKDLAIESGATLNTGSFVLNVTGDLDVGGNISGAGFLTLTGTGKNARGAVSTYVEVAGGITLNGPFTTAGQLVVSSGSLTVGGQSLTVGTQLSVNGTGQLQMSSVSDSVDVGGTATWSSATTGTGKLSAGVLVLRGDFSQSGGSNTGFAPSGTHRTRFMGSATQSVFFGNPGSANSRFQDVEFGNPAGITIGSTVTNMGVTTVSAGTVTGIGRTINLGGSLFTSYSAWQVSNTLWGQNPTVYPDSLPRNVTVFNGWTLTKPFKTDSNLTVNSSGILDLNGNTLQVGGTMTQSGILRMQSNADTLDVKKLFTVNSGASSAGELTNGMIRLHGGFAQAGGAVTTYQPSGSHVTRFEGLTGQTASFTSPALINSRFMHLELADSVNFTSNMSVAGSVSLLAGGKAQSASSAVLAGDLGDPTRLGWRYQTTVLSGIVGNLPDSLVTNLILQASWALTQRTKVTGTFIVSASGTLDLNGDTLAVTGTMTQAGIVTSVIASSLLDVGGNLNWNSGVSGVGMLSNGRLTLHQGFTQTAGAADNFAPYANFVTTFAGTGGHAVSFSTPSAGNSRFHHLEVSDSLAVSGTFTATGDVTLSGTGRISGTAATLLGGLVDPASAGWRMATTWLGAAPTQFPDSVITDLNVAASWTLPGRMVVVGDLTVTPFVVLGLGGQRLNVTGSVIQDGHITMNAADESDTLDVGGDYTVSSTQSAAGDLTYGIMILRGNFAQVAGANDNFVSDSFHTVRFAGTGGHAVVFSTPGFADSRFNRLDVGDSLVFQSDVYARGMVSLDSLGRVTGTTAAHLDASLDDPSFQGWRVATTVMTGKYSSLPANMTTDLYLNDSIGFGGAATLNGTLTIGTAGTFIMGNAPITVTGDLVIGGILQMGLTNDSLDIGGNISVISPFSGAGSITNGVIVARGDFTQVAVTADNFVPSGSSRMRFLGAGAHAVNFASPTVSAFHDVIVAPGVDLSLASDVRVWGMFQKPAGTISHIVGTGQWLLEVGDLDVTAAGFDSVRVAMHGSSNTLVFDDVAFNGQDPALTQLTLELPGQTGDTIKLNNVAFSGTPTTGLYVDVVDSVANDGVAVIGFYNSLPLNGTLYTSTDQSPGDTPTVLWSHLDWQTQPTDVIVALPIVSAPAVVAVDPSGNPITAFSGTVTLSFANDPTGSAVLGGNLAAATGGVATFDSLTVSLAGSPFALYASAPGLGQSDASANFLVSIPIPSGTTTAFNNGGGDNDWYNGANWTAGVPDSTDNVFVFPGQTVTVNAPARANRVTIGTGGSIVLNATLAADSSVAAGNTISGGGQLVAQGTGTLTGQVSDLYVTGNYVVPTGGRLSAQSIVIDGSGVLDPGLDTISVADSLVTLSAGLLNMNGATAIVDVGGDARFAGSQSTLNSGLLRLRKGLYSDHGYALTFTPATAVEFLGTGTQAVTYAVGDSVNGLGNVTFSGDTLVFATNVWIGGTFDVAGGVVVIDSTLSVNDSLGGAGGAALRGNTLYLRGAMTYSGASTVANTIFAGTGQTILPLSTPYDTVYVLGTAALGGTVDANSFWVGGNGGFLMGGQRLNVAGDFGTYGTGAFGMNAPGDSLMVAGNFYASGGPTTGLLTDGLLQIGGNFIQGNYIPCCLEVIVSGPMPAFNSFDADTGHITRIGGGAAQRMIYFSNPLEPTSGFAGSNSQFGTLELMDGSDSLLSTVPALGPVTMSGGALLGGTLAAAAKLTVLPGIDSFNVSSLYTGKGIDYQAAMSTFVVGETFFFGGDSIPVLPYQWLRVGYAAMALTGDLVVDKVTLGGQGEGPVDSYVGDLDLNGHALTVNNGFTTTGFGRVRMNAAADSLDVSGNMDLGGGDMTGLITDGVIVARGGNVSLSPGWTDTSFTVSGVNRFRMQATSGSMDLWISQSPGDPLRFANFEVAAGTTVNFNPYSNGALVVSDSLGISGFLLQAAPGKKVVALGDLYVGISLGITVDTVEVHNELEVSGAGYSVQWTRYAGTGQHIATNVPYVDLEVTGTVALDSNIVVGRDVYVSKNGVFDLTGAELAVTRNFHTRDSGVVVMALPTTTILADTAFFTGGNTSGLLTDGVLRVRALIQDSLNSPQSYAPSGNHLTQIGTPAGGSEYLIQFADTSGASHIQTLLLNDGGFGGVPTRITGRVRIAGKVTAVSEGSTGFIGSPGAFLSVGDSLIFQDPAANVALDTVELGGVIQVSPNTFFSTVVRFAGTGQAIPDSQSYQALQVTGTASPEGTATINTASVAIFGSGRLTLGANQRVSTAGTFSTLEDGTLAMTAAGADLYIGGDALFAGGSMGPLLGGGNIRVAGNFTTQAIAASDPFNSFNTGVTFQGSGSPQVVTIDPASNVNFRGVGIINTSGIQIAGLMLVTDSVGTSGPITGDSLFQFGPFNLNATVAVNLKVFKTAGLFSGLPSSYTVGRTHIVNANSLPNVTFDTLVVNANGVSAFYPLNASTLIIAAAGSSFATGPDAVLDLGAYGGVVAHTITGDVHIEGTGARLEVAEDSMLVQGDLYTSLGGTVGMNGAGALIVNGTTLFGGGSQVGLMTSGTLTVGSGITQQAFTSPSSFRMDGTVLDLPVGPAHLLNFETADSSWLPGFSGSGAGVLNLIIVNRVRVAGGIDAYGLSISGDTLITSGQLAGNATPGLSVTLDKYEGPVVYQFQNVVGWTVGTTQFTGDGGLPYSWDPVFDTLIISADVQGQLSQSITANYLEVTGPGNPRHVGSSTGSLFLTGGDGNTTVTVNGDVVVRGAGAHISSFEGDLFATGDFTVDQDAYFASDASFGNPEWSFGGSVVIDGTITKDSLVRGHLSIGGNFTQKGTTVGSSFAPDSTFTTEFTGTGTHVVAFQSPSAAWSTGSYFGKLAVGAAAAQTIDFQGDYYVEGALVTTSSNGVTFHNTQTGISRINAQDVDLHNVTFDHVQFRLEKHAPAPAGLGTMDIVNFTNFQNTEIQFNVILPGQIAGPFSWSNFSFTQLAASGTDGGRYIVATDWDGLSPLLMISLGTNQSGDPANYFVGTNGAVVTPFSP